MTRVSSTFLHSSKECAKRYKNRGEKKRCALANGFSHILQKKQLRKQRSKIEGLIGNLKKDYSLEKIVLKTKQGAQIQASLAMGAFNMFKALKEI